MMSKKIPWFQTLRTFLPAFFLLLPFILHGQGNQFSNPKIITNEVNGIKDVEAADFDKDNDHDLVIASFFDNSITWLKNNGKGSFDEWQLISNDVEDVQTLLPADMNKDGTIDVLYTSENTNTIGWFGNEDGSKIRRHHKLTGQVRNISAVKKAHLDSDKEQELLVGQNWRNGIKWYNILRDGSIEKEGSISAENEIRIQGPVYLHTADVNGDSRTDIIAAQSSDYRGSPDEFYLGYFEKKRDGSFGAFNNIGSNPGKMNAIDVADIDGDGDQDVVTAGQHISWYENGGYGGFMKKHVAYKGKKILEFDWMTCSDFDRDGDLDIIYIESSPSRDAKKTIGWLKNNGKGTFTDQKIAKVNNPDRLLITDLNGDNKKDIIFSSFHGDRVGWIENR